MTQKIIDTGNAATFSKVGTGVAFAANGGQALAYHAAKKAGSAVGGVAAGTLGVVGTGAGMAVDYWETEKGKQELAKSLGISIGELERRRAKDSMLLREVMENADEKKLHIGPKAGVVALGSTLGNLIPIPIVGMLAGGVAANYLYDLALMGANEEVAQMVTQIGAKHAAEDAQGRARSPVSGVQVFAIMAANAHKPLKNLIKKDLVKMTGSSYFSDALNTQKGQLALGKLMPTYESPITDSKDGFKKANADSVFEQIASEINHGRMRIADLLMTEKFVAAARQHNDKLFMQAFGIDPVKLSGMQMATSGVVHGPQDRSIDNGAGHRHRGQTVPSQGNNPGLG